MQRKQGLISGAVLLTVVVIALSPIMGQPGSKVVADKLCARGRTAFREESYEKAAALYRESLLEFTPHPEAAFGLGEALEKLGENDEAMLAYITCKDQFGEVRKPNSRQRKAAGNASRAIQELGGGYADLERAENEFVKACVSYGRKYRTRRPRWARRALEFALALEPNNSAAGKSMKKLGGVRAVSFGGPEELIEEDDLANFEFGHHAPKWNCKSGVLRGDIPKGTSVGWVLGRPFRGNLTIRWEMRLVSTHDPSWQIGILYGNPEVGGSNYGVMVDQNDDLFLSRLQGGNLETPRNKLLSNFDPRKWHRYELEVSRRGLTIRLDGEEIFTHRPPASAPAAGIIGVHITQAVAEFRAAEVLR